MPYIVFLLWLGMSLIYFVLDIALAYHVLQIKSKKKSVTSEGVSVIIAAKNETANLKQNLIYILQQQHPKFEVIVINDHSTDDTIKVLEEFSKAHSGLKFISITTGEPSKKAALTKGIEMSSFNTLCFTDADCKPQSAQWLSTMESYLTTNTPVVLGFSPYTKYKGLLNKLIRFETLQTAINYFGFAKMGQPYMAVGRNLMYTKTVFRSVNGFTTHEHLRSGDDDLFLKEVISKHNIALCTDSGTFVESTPKTTLKSWIAQKQRHITTANHYRTTHQFILSGQFMVRFLFWYFVLPFSGLLPVSGFGTILGLISVYTVLVFLKTEFWRETFKTFQAEPLLFIVPFLEFLLVNVQLYVFLSNLIRHKKDW